jgi:transposase
VRDATVWRQMLGVDRATVIVKVSFEEEGDEDVVVVQVRQRRSKQPRCGKCGEVAPRYDRGEGPRRWRAHDLGLVRCYLEAEAPRVRCSSCGLVVAQVPWARHDARHTYAFDDYVAWLVTHTAKSTLVELLRIAWTTVGAIVGRVVDDARAAHDPFAGLMRIGIDEISYKRGHKYLTVVIDHDTRRLVWAAPGRDRATLTQFFERLGPERAARIVLVSADAAEWIATVVAKQCPKATLCADPFHIVAWATDALDEVRRQHWRDAKVMGSPNAITRIKGCRYALLKNPDNLTERQAESLAKVARLNTTLYRAYLLKEELRLVFQLRGEAAIKQLDAWCSWAQRCRIEPMVELYQRIKKHRASIEASVTHGLSNGLIESTNTKLRLLTRMAYGFRSTDNLIALCMLDRGGYRPPLPGR